MGFSDLYIWDISYQRGPLHVKAAQKIDYRGLFRGDVVPTEPVKFVRSMGGRPQDIVTCEYVVIWLVSDKVVNLLRGEGITGWRTFPVEVTGKGGTPITGYHGFAVTGRCGPVDPRRSVPAILPPLVPGGPARHQRLGLYFDLNTWDGSDVFVPANIDRVFVVRRVKEVLERNKIPRCEFEPAKEAINTMDVD